jgi:transposase
MAKYDDPFKLKVAQEAALRVVAVRKLASQYGVDPALIRRWRDSYLRHGPEGVASKCTLYSAAFKQRVLERIALEGLSHRQAMALFDIRNSGVISLWQRQYDSGGLDALVSTRERRARMRKKPIIPKPVEEFSREELLEEVLNLRAETAYLKKLDALIREEQATARSKKRESSRD